MFNKPLIIVVVFFYNLTSIAQSMDLTNYLPHGYVKDGSVDYTKYLQKGLDCNDDLTFPDFPVLINQKGLFLSNDQTLYFSDNSCLLMKPNEKEKYALLNLINVKNVKINNPILEGDRYNHLGNSGEWGMGINIRSSQNIAIINPNISNCWGDGIYIGEIDYKQRANYNLDQYTSKKILIQCGVLDANRRNGISIISVKGLLIKKTLIQNTQGTLPMAAIDLEPNNNSQFLENITISKVVTKNNTETGIKYVSSNFLGKRNKNVNITINDCKVIGSKVGLYLGGARASYKSYFQSFGGEINIENFKAVSTNTPIRTGSIQKFNPKINISDFKIYDGDKRDVIIENKLKSKFRNKKINIK